MAGDFSKATRRVEVIVPPPQVENRDFGYFNSPPLRRLVPAEGSDGHTFQWMLTSPDPDVFVAWRPALLPQAGRYEVAVFVPRTHATTTQALYFVHGAAGAGGAAGAAGPVEARVNQAQAFDAWLPLGTFTFDPAADADIFVDAQNYSAETPPQQIAFDALRWRLIQPGAPQAWVWPVLDEPHVIGHPFNEPRPSFGANHLHEGVDVFAEGGKPVVCVVPGTLRSLHHWNAGVLRGMDAYGNYVVVEHDDGSGSEVLYGHLADFAPGLTVGQHVDAGQLLGFADSSGNSSGSHLHLTLSNASTGLNGYVYPNVLDPTPFLLNAGGVVSGGETRVTNQSVVNLLFKIAPDLGREGWPLVEALSWQDLAVPSQNRNLSFDPARLQSKPAGVTSQEWNYLAAKVDALLQGGGGASVVRMPEGFHALPGVHGPAVPDDAAWHASDGAALAAVAQSGVAAVKVLVPGVEGDTVRALAALPRVKLIVAGLYAAMDVPAGADAAARAQAFVRQVDPPEAGNNGPLARAFNAGVRYFEVHSRPNTSEAGMFANWQNGRDFADFFVVVTARLRARYRGARFGFPGLAPGAPSPGARYPAERFLAEAAAALRDADFLCVHARWGGDGTSYQAALSALAQFCLDHPDKVVFLSEFSNNASVQSVGKDLKGDQYREFYRAVQALPGNLGAVFAYCLAGGSEDENWIDGGGLPSSIIAHLGLE